MLEFYLTTIILSILIDLLLSKAMKDKFKNEGYVFIPKTKSLSEKIIGILQGSPLFLIPLFNIILSITGIVNFEEMYEDIKNGLLKDGEIILKSDKETENVLADKKITTLESNSKTDYFYEDRYLLNAETKTTFFKRITDLIIKIESIEDKKTKKNLLIRIKNITSQFNQANERLEKIDPQKHELLRDDKITISNAIDSELSEIENVLDNILRKQERQHSDKEQFKTLYKKIEEVQKSKR